MVEDEKLKPLNPDKEVKKLNQTNTKMKQTIIRSGNFFVDKKILAQPIIRFFGSRRLNEK